MTEVVITNPEFNFNHRTGYSYYDKFAHDIVRRQLKAGRGINPQTHPKVADVCAGDGSWARIFIDNGWKPEDILCIDQFRSRVSLIEGVAWRYWDVAELGVRLLTGDAAIPNEVLEWQGKFDIVVLINSGINHGIVQEVCRFLVRSQGQILSS